MLMFGFWRCSSICCCDVWTWWKFITAGVTQRNADCICAIGFREKRDFSHNDSSLTFRPLQPISSYARRRFSFLLFTSFFAFYTRSFFSEIKKENICGNSKNSFCLVFTFAFVVVRGERGNERSGNKSLSSFPLSKPGQGFEKSF